MITCFACSKKLDDNHKPQHIIPTENGIKTRHFCDEHWSELASAIAGRSKALQSLAKEILGMEDTEE